MVWEAEERRTSKNPIDALFCLVLLCFPTIDECITGSSESRDSFMTTAGQLYVNRDTDAAG